MSKSCPRCERLPEAPPENGILYLAPPINEAMAALEAYLSRSGFDYSQPSAGVFAVQYDKEDLERLCTEFLCNVSQLEMQDTKTMILPKEYDPTVKDFIGMQPLSSLVARIEGVWLIDLLREDRITAFFQPIVSVAQPDVAYGYECLSRGVDPAGEFIPPNRLFGVARAADLLFNLDRACRLAVIRDAMEQGIGQKLFINFNPTSIYNPEYCLKTTMSAISKAGIPAEQIVFEVVESEEVGDTDHLLRVLDYYRDRGFKVALDDMGAGYSSLNLLYKLRPDYMKLDIGLIRDVDKDSYKARITENLLQLAGELDVLSIAEGVETVEEWKWLQSRGTDLVQGYLFAKPAPVPPLPNKV